MAQDFLMSADAHLARIFYALYRMFLNCYWYNSRPCR